MVNPETQTLTLHYQPAILPASHASTLLQQFKHTFHWTLENPHLAPLSLPSPETNLSILNNDPIARTSNTTSLHLLHHLFEQTAAHYPDFIALEFLLSMDGHKTAVTYRELNDRANRLANYLLSKAEYGIGPDAMVPIIVSRSVEFFVALLGVLKAGAAYVPLAEDTPSERVKFVCGDIGAKVIIVDTACVGHGMVEGLGDDVTLVVLDDSKRKDAIDAMPSTPPTINDTKQEHLAYVLYTSGSTGTPKGVLIPHGAAIESILAHQPHIPHRPASKSTDNQEKYLQFASPAFDLSVLEIFFPLSVGQTVCAAPKDLLISDLEGVVNIMRVSHANLTPSVAGLLRRDVCKTLQALVTAGEMLTGRVVDQFADGTLHNAWGPTETVIHCTIAPRFKKGWNLRNVGIPFDTSSIYVVDRHGGPGSELKILPAGYVGEICVGGKQMARGYLNLPSQTDESFRILRDPTTNEPKRVYRTGDLGRILPDGTIEFAGRVVEGQVKLRGQRVELGEISQVLGKEDLVKEVVVLVLGDDAIGTSGAGKVLVGFISVGRDSGECDVGRIVDGVKVLHCPQVEQALLQRVQKTLPSYMWPDALISLESIPKTSNGKTDRRALENIYCGVSVSTNKEVEMQPDDARLIQSRYYGPLVKAIAQLANNPETKISPSTKLISLGIDSLQSIILCSRLREEGFVIAAPALLKMGSATIRMVLEYLNASKDDLSDAVNDERKRLKTLFDEYVDEVRPGVVARMGDVVEDVYPATPLQDGLLAETMKDGSGRRYFDHIVFRIVGNATLKGVDAGLVCEAWEAIVRENPVFRTGFVEADSVLHADQSARWAERYGAFVNVVFKAGPAAVDVVRAESEDAVEEAMKRHTEECVFALGRPLVKMLLVECGETLWVGLGLHHAVYDGWVVGKIIEDLQGKYCLFSDPDASQLDLIN